MMEKSSLLDIGFNLNYTRMVNFRFMMLHKFNLISSYSIPQLKKLTLYSYINGVESFWNNRALGSFLLFFFVTGNLPLVSRFKIFQTFKRTTYNATISINLNKIRAPYFLLGLSLHVLDAISMLDRNFRFYERVPGLYSFVLSDWTSMKEITVHPAFFRWRENIFGKFFISGGFAGYTDFFLSLFKLKI